MLISAPGRQFAARNAAAPFAPHSVGLIVIILLLEKSLVKLANCMAAVDHCYSDIGCFPLSEEFYHPRHRPFNVRPWHRRRINTHFLLFNRANPNGYLLEPWDRLNLMASRFNPSLETKIIIPGWLDSLKRAVWVKRLKDSLLWLWQPVNIIIVHWQNFTPYTIATANTRVVGAELANLLKSIEAELNYDRAYYHLIGHSLGAHIGGYCGDRLPGLGRITALDPARPFFQHMPKSVRLDRGDAKFVDAIHSDFTPENAILLLMSFGMSTPVGHLDFYPNGHSLLQPGCLRDTLLSVQTGIMRGLEHSSLAVAFLEAVRYLTACDHQRSHEWFIESITNRQCVFVGVRCNEFEGLINGRCTCDDSPSACAIMGIHADQMFVHNLHEEIWPLGARGSGKNRDPRNYHPAAGPTPAPPVLLSSAAAAAAAAALFGQQLSRPSWDSSAAAATASTNKDHIRQQLRHEAAKLRQPAAPQLEAVAAAAADDADELYVGLDHMQDAAFVSYLQSNLLRRRTGHAGASAPAGAASVPYPFGSPSGKPPFAAPIPRPSRSGTAAAADDDDDGDRTPTGGRVQRRLDAAETNFRDEIELVFSGNNAHPLNKHPKLLSDLDRDIESWYEDTSRWFLKTNNRPNYCVNQYQILIYLGPLGTTNGHKHLRANLIVSLIGTRGQLMNQRFIPRSAKLDSYTMQPFFVVLEGSFTLGSVLSVAVGWEARTDPDPIQATVSFQSNLLESVQAVLPAPPRLRPFVGETLKYDHSAGFRWRPAARSPLLRQPPASLMAPGPHLFGRRSSIDHSVEASGDDERNQCLVEDDETGQCEISGADLEHESASEQQARLLADLLVAENAKDTTDIGGDGGGGAKSLQPPPPPASNELQAADGELSTIEAALAAINAHLEVASQLLAGHSEPAQLPRPRLPENPKPAGEPSIRRPASVPIPRPSVPAPAAPAASSRQQHQHHHHHHQLDANENRITAEFHNINNLHYLNRAPEDSIIINQIVVNPLQANYGKDVKSGKVFCPAQPGQRLRRDQTVRLRPTILGRCPVHRPHY